MIQFTVKYMAFPEDLRGKTLGTTIESTNIDDRFVILIDSTRTPEVQKQTVKHELAHIFLNHFHQPWKTEAQREAEAEEKAIMMTDEEMYSLLRRAVNIRQEVAG